MKFLFLFLFCSIGNAFTLISPGVKGYTNHEIHFDYNQSSCPSNVDLAQLVNESIAVWNNVATSDLKLVLGSPSTSVTGSYPPVAYCDNAFVGGASGFGGSYVDSNGVLQNGSLKLNTNPSAAWAIYNLTHNQQIYLLAHEIGHVLGLGHSPVDYALMSWSFEFQTHLELAQDDIDGISYLYPYDEQSSGKAFGCGLVKLLPPAPSSTKLALFFLLLMPMLISIGLRNKKSFKIKTGLTQLKARFRIFQP